MNPCPYKKQHFKEITFPARIFGYLALCENLKLKIKNNIEEAKKFPNNLPLVSKITSQATPQGLAYARLCFLKYSH